MLGAERSTVFTDVNSDFTRVFVMETSAISLRGQRFLTVAATLTARILVAKTGIRGVCLTSLNTQKGDRKCQRAKKDAPQ